MIKDFRHFAFVRWLAAISPGWVIVLLCVLMAAHLLLRTPDFPYTPDSASYIEQARNLAQHGSALETPYGLDSTVQQPSRLFPIGYPVVLALINQFGVDPRDATVALSWTAGLILPVLLFASFRRALGAPYAALLAALAGTTPSILTYATLGTSDIFALVLAIATIGLVLRSPSRFWLLFGGVIAGCAYAVRNTHLALLLAIAIYYAYLWITKPRERRETTLNAAVFLLGASLILLPILIRNLMLFGAVNPYQMEPSTISAIQNVRTYIQESVYDLSGLRALGTFFGWSKAGVAMLLGFVVGVAWLCKASWQELTATRQNTIFLCTTYSVIGACVVVAARSRYEWGEMINTRHTLQYTPFLWATLLALLPAHAHRLRPAPIFIIVAMLVILAGTLHLFYAFTPRDLLQRSQNSTAAMNAYENGKDFFCQPGSKDLTGSNWGYIFRIQCGATTRIVEMEKYPCMSTTTQTISTSNDCGIITNTAIQIARKFPGQPIKLGFFVGRGIPSKGLPLPQNDYAQLENAGLHVLKNDAHGIVLSNQSGN